MKPTTKFAVISLILTMARTTNASPPAGWYRDINEGRYLALISGGPSAIGALKTIEFFDQKSPHKPRSAVFVMVSAPATALKPLEQGLLQLQTTGPIDVPATGYAELAAKQPAIDLKVSTGQTIRFVYVAK